MLDHALRLFPEASAHIARARARAADRDRVVLPVKKLGPIITLPEEDHPKGGAGEGPGAEAAAGGGGAGRSRDAHAAGTSYGHEPGHTGMGAGSALQLSG